MASSALRRSLSRWSALRLQLPTQFLASIYDKSLSQSVPPQRALSILSSSWIPGGESWQSKQLQETSAGLLTLRRWYAKGGKGGGKAPQEKATPASDATFDLKEVQQEIDTTIDHLSHELANIRSGRATPEMLDFLQVEAYGEKAPLKGLAAVSVKDARLLSLSVYDPSVVENVMKAIRESPLQLDPTREGKGQEIFVPVPPPTQDTVKALEKLVHKAGEATKVSIRHVRHKGIQTAKEALASKDDQKRAEKDVQKLVDNSTKEITAIMNHKIKSLHE